MASDTREIFDTLYPQFASLSSDAFDILMGLAAKNLSAEAWGANYQEAVIHLTAHRLMLRDRGQSATVGGSAAGAVNSISEDGQSISFDGSSGMAKTVADASLESTTAGQCYLELRNRTISGPYTTPED